MKKLLSILTITTLTASVPAPLLANTTLERTKRDVGSLTSNSNNDYVTMKKITGISSTVISVDSNDNIYFGTNGGAYKLTAGSDTPIKINGFNDIVNSIAVDSSNNIYIGTSDGLFVLKHGETTPIKINNIRGYVNSIAVDSSNNIYIGTSMFTFVLKHGETTPIKINNIRGYVNSIAVDSSNNIYIGTSMFTFVLKHGETTPIKINGFNDIVNSIAVDSNDNVYIAANGGAFVLKHGETTAREIEGMGYWIYGINIDSSNNIYIGTKNGAFVLKHGETTPIKINNIRGYVNSIAVDSSNNIYIGTSNGAYKLQTALSWTKQQSKFILVDSTKKIVWLRDDQLVANGQVKVKIANTDIETVKVNGDIMPSPDKNWDFNLPEKSTTVENKDYKIEIAFKLDGKSYTGQIILSSLLSQPNITVKKNTSPFGNVASYVYQVPTNDKVGEFTLTSDLYYSDTEVKVSLNKPTGSTVQSGIVYGLNDKWQKTGQQLDITGDVSLNATMLNSYQGRFLVETKDSAGNSSFYYIALNKNNLTPNFWDTDQGQQFYEWANLNGYNESIKKLNATELNKIINESKNWQQLASDSQFASAVADWFKTNGKLSSKEPLTKEQIVEQLKTQTPSDIKIAGVNTNNYDVNKVSFELNKSEFNPNDKVNITVKYNNASAEQFTLQIKDSNTPDNEKDGDSKLWIIGVVVGVLAGLGIAYLLFKRFVFDKYIYPKIIARRHNKLVEQIKKEEAEKDAQNNKGGEK